MKNLRYFLLLVPLFLGSCSEKKELNEPASAEKDAPTEPLSQDAIFSGNESEAADSSIAEETNDGVSEQDGEDTHDSAKNYPEVKMVPGKPGFVYSPYNHQIIDVQGLPSGTLVADPTYPMSEKKYFRVP